MGRHGSANKRYIGILMLLPLGLLIGAFIFVNPMTKSWVQTYASFLTPIDVFYGIVFGVAGAIALLFELPYTRPNLVTSGRGGMFGTIFVALFGGICVIFAGLIFMGLYNITSDTSIYNFFLGYVIMPGMGVMFTIEVVSIFALNKRFALHGGVS